MMVTDRLILQQQRRIIWLLTHMRATTGASHETRFVPLMHDEHWGIQGQEPFGCFIEAVEDYAIFLLDKDGRVASWNRGAQRIEGWRADEILGRPIEVFYPPEDVACGWPDALLRKARAVGRVEDEGWRVRKDGTWFHAEVVITALHGQDGSVRGFAEVTRDDTARWKAEQRRSLFEEATRLLATSLDNYEAALASLAHLAVRSIADFCVLDLVDEKGRVRRVEVAHADPHDVDLANRLRHVPAEKLSFSLALDVLRTGHAQLRPNITPKEFRAIVSDDDQQRVIDEIAPRSVVAVPLTARSRILGVMTLLNSRSGRAYDEDDVGLAVELGARAGLHVDNARLYQAGQQAIQARDELLGVVAHDLRNLLNTIAVRTQFMLHKIPDEAGASDHVRGGLEAIGGAVVRMDLLIRDLLDVTLVEARQMAQERGPCSAHELIEEAVEMSRPLAIAKALCLQTSAESDMAPVFADRDRIHQVLSNLLGNAIKFTPRGGCIHVRAERSGPHVSFAVSDTGPGIASEELPHVFDRFWQAKRTDRRGAGLGLAICKGIVEAHGGAVLVESTCGAGTTFRFTLPLTDRRD